MSGGTKAVSCARYGQSNWVVLRHPDNGAILTIIGGVAAEARGRLLKSRLKGSSIMTIFTIGYEGLNTDMFMTLLSRHSVETIVDIRELPLSRKPGFSKKSLATTLNCSGLEYVHMVNLGCPRPVRERYKADGNWGRYTEGFLTYLKTQDTAIAALSELVKSSNCALLCFEADPNYCHRSLVAAAVQDYAGMPVTHIRASSTVKTIVDPQNKTSD
jgi:hypothetical protein